MDNITWSFTLPTNPPNAPKDISQKLTISLLSPSSNNNHIRLPGLLTRANPNLRPRPPTVRRIPEIPHLAFKQLFLGIHHDDLAAGGGEDERVRDGRTDIAGADDGDCCLETVGWCGGCHFEAR